MKNKNLLTSAWFVAAAAVFCTMLWGTAFPAIKIGYREFGIEGNDVPSILCFAGARFIIAGLFVIAAGFISEKKDKKPILRLRDIPPVSLLSLFQTYGQYMLLYIGIVNVSGTSSSLFTSMSTFASVLLSAAVFRSDKLTVKKLSGCIIGFAGISVMFIGGAGGSFSFFGEGLVILSNIFGGIGNVISKKISPGRTPSLVSGWQLFIGGSALFLSGLISGGTLNFKSVSCVLILLYLGFMAGGAFVIWTTLLFHNPVSRVAVYNLLIPVFGTMWSAIFLGEQIFTLRNLCAIVLICGGIFLAQQKQKNKE